MALNNPLSIKDAVDQVIDTYGQRIKEIGVGEDWRDFCSEVGHDPNVEPAVYRSTEVRPSAIGFEIILTDWH